MSALARQLAYGVLNAPVRTFPYPHIFVENIFPTDFYARLQANIPDPREMVKISEARPVTGYDERFVLDPEAPPESLPQDQQAFWRTLSEDLREGGFRNALLTRFDAYLRRRFAKRAVRLKDETLLVEDVTKYALGPHTDHVRKVVTVLFYLPPDLSQAHLGTSMYMPTDPERRCEGGPHYPREDGFDRVATMPFLPNSMFAFVKSDRSFHGVEQIVDTDVRRWLLLYDIRVSGKDPEDIGDLPAAADNTAYSF